MVVVNRVLDILDLAAVAQIPETPLKILLLNRCQVLGNVAVEAVGDIRTIGNTLDDAVFLAELLDLQTAQTLCRCTVDSIQIAVLILELFDLIVDILQCFEGKLTVLGKRFAVVQLLQLVKCSNAERRGSGFMIGLILSDGLRCPP